PPLAAGAGLIDAAAAAHTPLFARPASVSFGLRRPGGVASATVDLRGAGAGPGSWRVLAPGLEAPANVDVPAGGKAELRLRLRVAAGASVGDRQGYVTLQRGTDALHLPWWGYVERPRLASERVVSIRPGWKSGDTRRGVARVSRYRWPADPAGWGLPPRHPGREVVFSFRVPAAARNARVA